MKRIVLGGAVLALTLGACAKQTDLEPTPGASLPPQPYGAPEQPDADDLLDRPTQAAPERNRELRTRSEERKQDPFDLPPEG
ncbi:hypothetical protein [Croceicoccus naphthovorans]|uniref:Argininosuccinate lyase n=1 Tax=Croceicoccus naphthovorans TaxID=1348774 RepID=A0A0G3XJN0_9SPHN|nr:hypothetical protein [Croceicoccus naphthovorans]AKM10563.1 argininosuccinate lyase [Croceicoccus naphthovorans]MBB3988769.1 hypothetical protein [Croceicoccus naphthovorans]